MDWKLEVVPVPVTDTDRAIAFYRDQLGFTLDEDVQPFEGIRFVQLTPRGSGCSIVLGDGMTDMPPGSIEGYMLVVDDLDAARDQLLDRKVAVSTIQHYSETGLVEGRGDAWNAYIFLSDPDGNRWTIQERPAGHVYHQAD